MHQCYGEELGLTSDDEDYIAPRTEEDKLSARLSLESFSEVLKQNKLLNLVVNLILHSKNVVAPQMEWVI